MDTTRALALLAGQSPAGFMRRHWQKRPLLVRQALPGVAPPATPAQLFVLAAQDDVESRLVVRRGDGWRVKPGPLPRRALPPIAQPGWTLLVQGLDLHLPSAHDLLSLFRFVPAARLDDLMVSYASDGGGVGPHVDAYDVFLLQVQGRRRWRIAAPTTEHRLRDDVPLKMLADFRSEEEWLLEPGDMLYLPPHWGHEGIAEGSGCMTCSIGFRSPRRDELARELLLRLADSADDETLSIYRDPAQPATPEPGRIPLPLAAFARKALARVLDDAGAFERSLGEALSEPKPAVWFEAARPGPGLHDADLALDRRTRMLYDERHVYINGESFRAAGRDAALLRRLADDRRLGAPEAARLSPGAREVLDDWLAAGWLARTREGDAA